MQNPMQELKREIIGNLSELLSAFFVMVLMLLLIYMVLTGSIEKTLVYMSVAAIGSGLMLLIGFEKRGKTFDKYVSLAVLFFLSISFMFL